MSDPVRLGQAAQRLLEDATVREVFARVDAEYKKAWEDASRSDIRELYWARVHALKDVQLMLTRIRDAGLRVEKQLQ